MQGCSNGHAIHQTKNCNRSGLRASHEADTASSASRAGVARSAVAIVIQPFAQVNHPGRTCFNTQTAPLAFIRINSQQASIPLFRAHRSLFSAVALSDAHSSLAFQVVRTQGEIFQLSVKTWISNCDQCLRAFS